jgi:hypothetical protein
MDQTEREKGTLAPQASSARRPWQTPTVIVSEVAADTLSKLNHMRAEYERSGISYSLS